MDWNELLIPSNDMVERDLGDELVIMTQNGEKIHSFEDSALLIWKFIKEEIIPEKIISELIKEYDVEEDLARKDLSAFIIELQQKGILKKNPRF